MLPPILSMRITNGGTSEVGDASSAFTGDLLAVTLQAFEITGVGDDVLAVLTRP